MANIARLSRSLWKPVLAAFLCGASIVSLADRVSANTGIEVKQTSQNLKADRSKRITALKYKLQILTQQMSRLEILMREGAISKSVFDNAQKEVNAVQEDLNNAIYEDSGSPKTALLMRKVDVSQRQLKIKKQQLERQTRKQALYKLLLDNGAISHIEYIQVVEQASILMNEVIFAEIQLISAENELTESINNDVLRDRIRQQRTQ